MKERFRIEVTHKPYGYEAVVIDAEGNRAAIDRIYRTERSTLKAAAKLCQRLVAAADYAAKESK